MKNEILLVLSADVYFDQANSHFKDEHSLENLELLPDIANTVSHVLNSHCKPKICWLVSNNDIILKNFIQKKDDVMLNNDEIGLHCLISKMFDISSKSKLEIERYIENAVRMMNNYGLIPLSARMAGCSMNNNLLAALQKYGIKVDSSALPKRKRDETISFDWSVTESTPYFPSVTDYRITDSDKTKCHSILEVPLTTISTKAPYDKESIFRYLDLCFKPKVIADEITNIVKEKEIIVTIIHPMQLLKQENKNELFGTGIDDFKTNLIHLRDSCEKFGRKIKCVSFMDLYKLFTN
ncbi:hypothetical protein [Candidatus Nitrosotenuis aquarius]|uniref:hypothetical protein n=1 Tax=Candidatus Nitrosotenuis aquarius TaxID=1846278 RepID=UPI0013C2EF5E|nr:hypothetical protein [Candidatus Nitrosotenuis aquarius]